MKGGRLGFVELMKHLLKEIVKDDLTGQAAQCAYALAFSLFPLILLAISIASFLPVIGPAGPIPPEILQRLPPDVQSIISTRIQEIAAQKNGGALTFAALLAMYTASSGMATLITGVNRAYDIPEQRPFWKRLLVGSMMALAGIVLIMIPALSGAIGAVVAHSLERVGLGGAAAAVEILRWPAILVGAFAWLALLFRVSPERLGRWRIITPGAIFSALGLAASNVGLSIYVSKISNMSASYGAVGGFIVLLLWLYISSLVLLIGAEINSILEEAERMTPRPTLRELFSRSGA